jgi:hypothetical protein
LRENNNKINKINAERDKIIINKTAVSISSLLRRGRYVVSPGLPFTVSLVKKAAIFSLKFKQI